MATIIIPAHNEASVIGRTLSALVPQLEAGDEIVVVSNASTDDTESVARGYGAGITVLSTPIPSKTNALNLGEQYAKTFPRIYLDADIRLAPGALSRIKAELALGDKLAVSPKPRMDFSGSSWAVNAYYRIWLSLPYCRSGMMGAGVYALSESGRQRFEKFPQLIADDGYVRALFQEHERGNVEDAYAIVCAPANLRWLLKIKTRSRLGQMQLAQLYPNLRANEQKAYGAGAVDLFRNPLYWPSALIYLYVTVISRVQAKRRFPTLPEYKWEKDASSRHPVSEHSV